MASMSTSLHYVVITSTNLPSTGPWYVYYTYNAHTLKNLHIKKIARNSPLSKLPKPLDVVAQSF
jgi:hypothetical protein